MPHPGTFALGWRPAVKMGDFYNACVLTTIRLLPHTVIVAVYSKYGTVGAWHTVSLRVGMVIESRSAVCLPIAHAGEPIL